MEILDPPCQISNRLFASFLGFSPLLSLLTGKIISFSFFFSFRILGHLITVEVDELNDS
uniref:Uncharacterized protein n=1 Tax=Nelumbo nucifera TaxID=4432 RepID=A0A822XNG8_NELNU|nr:TPA_asm: hypothetical protein HUJ06_022203 [Nelumbo nucifera]